MALPLPVIPPQPDAFHLAPHRIKRCTFRRLINVEVGNQRVYDVECLFPDRKVPIPLGDLEAATPICNACVAPHIFRPDEDCDPARGAATSRWAIAGSASWSRRIGTRLSAAGLRRDVRPTWAAS